MIKFLQKLKANEKMNKHIRYLAYVLIHKWFVLKECWKLHIPWRGIVHDLSKFSRSEWSPYVNYFYGEERTDVVKEEFNKAWLHHQRINPHHWQLWVLFEDSGKIVPLEMPENYMKEMLADWRGAGIAIKGFDDTKNWYLANKDKMILHEYTRNWIERQLGV